MKRLINRSIFVILIAVCLTASLPLRALAEEGHTVFFDNGGIAPETQPAPQSGIPDGSRLPIPTPPVAEGYVFEGWYVDPELKTPFNFESAITEDMMLYAKWEESAINVVPTNPVVTPDVPENPTEPEVPVTIPDVPQDSTTPTTPAVDPEPQVPQEPVIEPQNQQQQAQQQPQQTNTGAKTPDVSEPWLYCLFVAFFGILLCVIFMVIPERHKKGGNI